MILLRINLPNVVQFKQYYQRKFKFRLNIVYGDAVPPRSLSLWPHFDLGLLIIWETVFDAAWIVLCECLQKKEATSPISFKSVVEHNRAELKEKTQVTDELLRELLNRCILIQQDVDHIRVSC